MGESFFLFTLTASAYFLTHWCLKQPLSSLVLAATFGLLGTLIRYEGWFFIAAETLVVIVVAYRQGGYRKAEGLGLAFAMLVGLGPALWLLWSAVIFGSPVYFLAGDYSARAQQVVLEGTGQLPTVHSLARSLQYYLYSIGETNGFLLGWLALFALPFIWWERRYRVVIVVFLAVAVFEVIALYFGVTVIYLPYLFPYGSFFNVRYGLLMLPLIALLVAYLVSRRQPFLEFSVGVLVVLQIFFLYRELPVTLAEPLLMRMVSENRQNDGADFFRNAYQGGRALVVPLPNDAFMLHTGLPMREFVTDGNREYWKEALYRPENSVEWIVRDTSINYFTLKEQGNIDFALKHFYRLEWNRKGLLIYQRIPQAVSVLP
jgi:hypothetical protein